MVWGLIGGFVVAAVLSVMLLTGTVELRYQRDVSRMVFNDNLGVLQEVQARVGATTDSLKQLLSSTPAVAADMPYIVVSMAERQLWFKRGNQTLFQAPVATGSGKEMVSGTKTFRFETPRGRLVVRDKEVDLRARHYDDWTIERWRMEPDDRNTDEAANPPLWKDLTLASIVAAAVWTAAAIIFS